MRLLAQSDVSDILRSLTQKQATQLLTVLSSALASFTSQGRRNDGNKLILQPQRTAIKTYKEDTTLIMPISDTTSTGVKVVTVPREGDIQGAITIYAPTGVLQGILNAAEITAFRTALAIMTLLVRWAVGSSLNMVIFGAGKQSEWHVRLALLLVPGIKSFTLINRSKKRLEELDRSFLVDARRDYPNISFDILAQQGCEDFQSKLRERLATAQVICCCTPSKEPLFTATDLQLEVDSRPLFISLIGSYKPEMQEVDTETMRLAKTIWVDSKEACLEESGELIRGSYQHKDLTEIGDLFSDTSDGKNNLDSTNGVTILKCVGMGLMDLAISKALLDIASDLGKGTLLADF